MPGILDKYSIGREICIEGEFNGCHYSNKDKNYFVYDFSVNIIFDNSCKLEVSEEIKVIGQCELNELHKILNCKLTGKVAYYNGEKQLEIRNIEVIEPITKEGIITFLNSGVFKGIDYLTAQKIVEGYYVGRDFKQGFGLNTIDIIKNNPTLLTRIKGINKSKAESMHKTYIKHISYQNISQFLKGYGLCEKFYTIKWKNLTK